MTLPTNEPSTFVAGETVSWQPTFEDYLSSDGWAASVHLRGASSLDAEATAEDDGSFIFTLSAEATAELTPGDYMLQVWVELDGERYRVRERRVTITPNLSETVENYDGRTDAERILAALDAMLLGKASQDQMSYTIAGGGGTYRQLAKMTWSELIGARKYYARLVALERRRERVRRGGAVFQTIKVRFDEP